MASIFTYETDPVQVASPWPRAPAMGQETTPASGHVDFVVSAAQTLSDYGISRLIPEPQDGPVEYKLHLLLRPRRSFSATSTVQKVSGSHLSKSRGPAGSASDASPRSGPSTPVLAPSNVSRQNRLQHLTTQLLWRLQQSSPHHASSKSDLIIPVLPEAEIHQSASNGPGVLIAGLEESLGALYEIGVSDDGSFVGLTRDELNESLTVLRAMSYSLGCDVQVLRMVEVGNCQWSEQTEAPVKQSPVQRDEKLWVAEVLVGPNVGLNHRGSKQGILLRSDGSSDVATSTPVSRHASSNGSDQQLRVTLTGSTTSGKSSLLGTLSTSTLDNGRGKSRLSLLKHRHEIVSGVTSSLAQELIGYRDVGSGQASKSASSQVVNYASAHVSSWNDIHTTTRPGRLVFVTDSAGHPRYRRTTVRGVISWAPNWTICCVAADDNEDSTGKVGATASASDILGSSGQGIDLSRAHLQLCLKLGLPLVVAITKYDLASKTGLRQTLAKVLSTLKDAGRKPAMLPLDPQDGAHRSGFQTVSKADTEIVKKVMSSVPGDELHKLVPIVLSSAVTGAGISKMHSLLRNLPILPLANTLTNQMHEDDLPLFHIDEVFTTTRQDPSKRSTDFIISGYLRYGKLGVGDCVLVGPFTAEALTEHEDDSCNHRASSYPGPRRDAPKSPQLRPRSHRVSASNLNELSENLDVDSDTVSAWHAVTVASIRTLRLPVRQLRAGQVATIAVNFVERPQPLARGGEGSAAVSGPPPLRRGMVLRPAHGADHSAPPAYRSVTAIFQEPNAYVIPGSSVTVYTASIRASAKIVEVHVPSDTKLSSSSEEVFEFDDDENDDAISSTSMTTTTSSSKLTGSASTSTSTSTLVADADPEPPALEAIEITFQFSQLREWLEMGTQVLVTPASGLSMLRNPLEVQQHQLERGESSSSAGGGGGGAGGGGGGAAAAAAAVAAGLEGFVGRIIGGATGSGAANGSSPK